MVLPFGGCSPELGPDPHLGAPKLNPIAFLLTVLVHRIVAFAFAMAIPRCQWRHRCVVTLGEILVVLYRKPLWRKEK